MKEKSSGREFRIDLPYELRGRDALDSLDTAMEEMSSEEQPLRPISYSELKTGDDKDSNETYEPREEEYDVSFTIQSVPSSALDHLFKRVTPGDFIEFPSIETDETYEVLEGVYKDYLVGGDLDFDQFIDYFDEAVRSRVDS